MPPPITTTEVELRAWLRNFSTERPRWGWRRAAKMARRAGWNVNNKRIQRLWRDEGLRVREGLVRSLGTVADAYDNAMTESLWGRMQTELQDRHKWATRLELSIAISDWIEAFHDPVRRHSALSYISPFEFERRNEDTTTGA
jgi:transposase InsO family protein